MNEKSLFALSFEVNIKDDERDREQHGYRESCIKDFTSTHGANTFIVVSLDVQVL